jgi:hypothetical protein
VGRLRDMEKHSMKEKPGRKLLTGFLIEVGKIGLSVCRSNPNRVYAIVEAENQKQFIPSDDAGKKWNLMSNDQNITSRSGIIWSVCRSKEPGRCLCAECADDEID